MSLFSRIQSFFSKPQSLLTKPTSLNAKIGNSSTNMYLEASDNETAISKPDIDDTFDVPVGAANINIEELSAILESQNRRYNRKLSI